MVPCEPSLFDVEIGSFLILCYGKRVTCARVWFLCHCEAARLRGREAARLRSVCAETCSVVRFTKATEPTLQKLEVRLRGIQGCQKCSTTRREAMHEICIRRNELQATPSVTSVDGSRHFSRSFFGVSRTPRHRVSSFPPDTQYPS